jgi:hypothetical protein
MLMDIQTISVFIAAVGILIAGVNSVVSGRHAAEERERQAFMELYATYRDKTFRLGLWDLIYNREITSVDEYMSRYGGKAIEKGASDNSVLAFYEGIGFFVKHGWLDIRYVEDLMAETIIVVWEHWQPLVEEWRAKSMPRVWENFEYLYHEVKKLDPQSVISDI